MEEGRLLGHIISKEGIKIDPERVSSIQKIGIPRSKKEIQSFIGRVNWLRRFIPSFAEILRNISEMLRKDKEIKWTEEARQSFDDIKRALTEAPMLISPDYSKDFIMFTYASEHTVAGVLLQKNQEGVEQPIAFFSKILRDAELKYNIMEKQAYALVKALKDFRIYILHSHIIAHVPSAAVKDILTQPDPEGKRAKWIAVLLEYDLDIKPTKLIKGQGLAKMMTETNWDSLGMNFLSEISKEDIPNSQVIEDFSLSPWYANIVYVLQNLQAPANMEKTRARSVKLKATKFCILDGNLFWKDPGGILLNCLLENEA
jgi:hypothetical protein